MAAMTCRAVGLTESTIARYTCRHRKAVSARLLALGFVEYSLPVDRSTCVLDPACVHGRGYDIGRARFSRVHEKTVAFPDDSPGQQDSQVDNRPYVSHK